MKLRTEEVKFKNGKTITITQENWDVSMMLSEEQRKAAENPLENKRLQYFREKLYPVLFAPSSGDVPAMDEVYAMLETSPDDLNEWYKAVQRINPGWFQWLHHHDSEAVTFSDETALYVVDANVPVGIMKIRDMEEIAQDHPADSVIKQIFRSTFYPKLAACSFGEVPDEESARLMPTEETNKWYEAVCRVNPHWFKPLLDLKAEVDAQEIKKKKPSRKRRK
jgi:hypothetical protein